MKEEAQKNPTVSSPVLFVKGVQKQYKNLLVLKQINLTLYKEEIVVLVGKNGSGKSTLFRILLGLDTPDKGIVATKQKIMPDDAAYREIVNGQHHVSSLYDNLTAIQNLDMVVGVFPNADAMQLDELIHVFGLETEMHKKAKYLSLGNGEKVAICRTLLTGAEVYLLDEPTIGLDWKSRAAFCHYLRELRDKEEKTVFLISHDPMIVEELADRVLLLEEGRLIQVEDRQSLLQSERVYQADTGVYDETIRE